MKMRVLMILFVVFGMSAVQLQAQEYQPYTKPPKLINRDVIAKELEAVVASVVPSGHEVATRVWLLVNTDGRTSDVEVRKSSGNPVADSAALRIVRLMRWQPAEKDDVPIAVHVELPVTFKREPAKK